jgi:nitrogen PTS system EIIA component
MISNTGRGNGLGNVISLPTTSIVNIVGRSLSDENIVVGLDVADKKQALEAAARLAGRRHHLDVAAIFRSLWRREAIGSTALGHGIAVPHARIAYLQEPIVLFIRTKRPIVFGAPDHEPVSVLFVILVPEHANEDHLQILACVSEMFANEAFRLRLSATDEPTAIQRIFAAHSPATHEQA